ncbi:MAG: hypothetical protein RL885_09040 [Planctomycetota bacterium]
MIRSRLPAGRASRQIALTFLSLTLLTTTAVAQPGWSKEFDRPGVDGRVFGLGEYNGDIVAGGYYKFSTDGQVMNYVARYDGTIWHELGSGVSGLVRCATTYQGDLIVGGQFLLAGGQSAASVARWDGTRWHPLGAGIDLSWNWDGAEVWDLAVYQGELYAGGQFDTAGGQPIQLIARWDGTSWNQVGSGLSSSSQQYPKVLQLDVTSDDRLIASGEFDTAGGQSAWNIAAWDGTSWSPLGSGLGNHFSSVFSLEEYQGQIYAGGNFHTAGGQAAEKIARWDGSSWHALGGGVPDWTISAAVYALQEFQGQLYVGGDFVRVDGPNVSASRLARWDGQRWSAIGNGGVAGMDLSTTVIDMMVIGDRLIVGGEFTVGGTDLSVGSALVSHDVIAFDGIRFEQVGRGLGGGSGKLLHWNGGIVMVGHFLETGSAYSPYISFFDGNDWSPMGVFDRAIEDAIVWNGELIVTGKFQEVDGQSIRYSARYDGTSWHPLGDRGGDVLEIYRGQLYAGGLGGVIQWNGTSWNPISSQIAGQVYDLEVFQDQLYIGGSLNSFSGPGPHLLVYDGQTVQGVGSGTSDYVERLYAYNGELLVGGRFQSVGSGLSAPLLARWTGSQWLAWPGPPFDGFSVRCFADLQGELYIGGDMYWGSGRPDDWLAKWNGSSWVAVGGGVESYVMNLLADEVRGHLWASGAITKADGAPSHGVARYEVTPPCNATWQEYGSGWPGAGGTVPSIALSAQPILGTSVSLQVSNPLGAATPATVLIGLQPDATVTRWGGTLLVKPVWTIGTLAPGGGLSLPFALPNDDALCGRSLFLQTVLIDPFASKGLAFTKGIQATLGR